MVHLIVAIELLYVRESASEVTASGRDDRCGDDRSWPVVRVVDLDENLLQIAPKTIPLRKGPARTIAGVPL